MTLNQYLKHMEYLIAVLRRGERSHLSNPMDLVDAARACAKAALS